MSITDQINNIKKDLPATVALIAVSKFQHESAIMEAYVGGQRIFGESRVQELNRKYDELPKDIKWHFIGHLQINKVKYITPFIDTIHSADSVRLLKEINKYAEKTGRKINVLIQIHIAQEEQKYGFSYSEAEDLFKSNIINEFSSLRIIGLMGMATFTEDKDQIQKEFSALSHFFDKIKKNYFADKPDFKELSMGMSDDYSLAVGKGSTMIRVGSKIFGGRNV